MADARKFVDGWLEKNITEDSLVNVFPRAEHIFNELFLDAEEVGLSRGDLWKNIPDLQARVDAAVLATSRKKDQ